MTCHTSPTSLDRCRVSREKNTDFSWFTCLTLFDVFGEQDARQTFPTWLKKLVVIEGELDDSNVSDIALEDFVFLLEHLLTRNSPKKLTKTFHSVFLLFNPKH